MKKLLIAVVFAFLALNINAQTFEFTSIDSTKLTKSECFTVCKTWVINNFKTNAALQMEDKDAGLIIVKGNLSTWIQSGLSKCEYVIDFKLTIQIKDYKTKVTLSDFWNTYSYCGGKSNSYVGGSLNDEKSDCLMTKKMWADIKTQSETKAKELLESIKTDIKNGKKSDNW
jgi:hypothetical protein